MQRHREGEFGTWQEEEEKQSGEEEEGLSYFHDWQGLRLRRQLVFFW